MRYYAWYIRGNSDKCRTAGRICQFKCVRGVGKLHSPIFGGIMIRL